MLKIPPVLIKNTWRKDNPLPKTNYKYEKRQKEIQKKKKQEEKLKRKQEKKTNQAQENAEQTPEQSVEK
jgi:hypothetical protein